MKGDKITLQVRNIFKYKKIFCQGLSPLQNNQFQFFFVSVLKRLLHCMKKSCPCIDFNFTIFGGFPVKTS